MRDAVMTLADARTPAHTDIGAPPGPVAVDFHGAPANSVTGMGWAPARHGHDPAHAARMRTGDEVAGHVSLLREIPQLCADLLASPEADLLASPEGAAR
jgi:hypothetical protein